MSDAEAHHRPPAVKGTGRDFLSSIPALVLTIGILLVVAFGFFLQGEKFGFQGKESQPALSHVELGKDYYVSISLIEVSEKAPDGSSWDSTDSSAPDVYAEIYWRGNRLYQSTTKENTFLAKWSVAEVHLKDVLLKGAKTSVDDLIQAARLHIRSGETIQIKVFDSDLFQDTLIGEVSFPLTDLLVGEQTFSYSGSGLLRLGVRVNDMSQAVDVLE